MVTIEPDEILGPDDQIPKTQKIERSKFKRYIKRKAAAFGNFLLIKVEKKLLEQDNVKQDRRN